MEMCGVVFTCSHQTNLCFLISFQDMVNGCYKVPWEEEVVHKDGTSCGFPPPTRVYQGEEPPADVSKF